MKIFVMAFAFMCFFLPSARAAEDLMAIYKTYDGDTHVTLDKAHRSHAELAEWISDAAAGVLAFTPGKTSEKLLEIRPLFSESGYKAYIDFMTSMGLAPAIENKTLSMMGIVDSAPLLIAQGASTGRYAWAYEVPVVLSINGKPGEAPVTRSVTLRIQFGRSAKGVPPHGVLIENWQMLTEAPPAAANAPQESGGQPVLIP
ncbi:MAG: hypothetical protein EBQ96_00540 [Proteobacteria bacterium]|nr:hypothetical protein [Pseudomonadota bacterium]